MQKHFSVALTFTVKPDLNYIRPGLNSETSSLYGSTRQIWWLKTQTTYKHLPTISALSGFHGNSRLQRVRQGSSCMWTTCCSPQTHVEFGAGSSALLPLQSAPGSESHSSTAPASLCLEIILS